MTLDLIVKVTILLAVVSLAVRYLRTPALSHFVRSLALVAILALPLLVAILPTQNLAILPPSIPAGRPTALSASPKGPVTTTYRAPGGQTVEMAVPPTEERAEIPWLNLLWGAGVLVCLARLGLGFYGLSRFRGIPVELASVDVEDLAFRVGLRKLPEVRFATPPDLATAMTWGVITPVVQLPMDAREWSPERLEAVLLHEFAHVRRRDFLSGLLGEFACALYWFHPIVWLSARAARADAESAADDAVLNCGVRPSSYAAVLLGLAADLGKKGQVPLSLGVTIMTEPKIESRLKSVLSPRALRRGMTLTQALAAVAVAILAVPALAGLRAVASERTAQERTAALMHGKGLALATLIYASDHDDRFPNASSTASAWKGIEPYAKSVSRTMKKPLTGPGGLNFNTHLSKVSMIVIPSPAETPMWVEKLSDPKEPFVVAFVDGHVKIRPGADRPAVEKLLRERFSTKPLPRVIPANRARQVGGLGN